MKRVVDGDCSSAVHTSCRSRACAVGDKRQRSWRSGKVIKADAALNNCVLLGAESCLQDLSRRRLHHEAQIGQCAARNIIIL